MDEITNRSEKLSRLISDLNWAYEGNNKNWVEATLASIKDIKEYFRSFNATKIKDFSDTDTEEIKFDVAWYFN